MDAATHEAAVTMVSALLANIQMLSVLLSDEPDATIVQALLNGAASALGEPERPIALERSRNNLAIALEYVDTDPERFKKNFRLTPAVFRRVVEVLRPYIEADYQPDNFVLTAEVQVLVTLHRLGSHALLRTTGEHYGLGEKTVHDAYWRVIWGLNEILLPQVLRWPTEDELQEIRAGFAAFGIGNNIIGAIDCTHVGVRPPKVHSNSYLNRKRHRSIVTQAVVDHRGLFLNLNSGFPGSAHDMNVLHHSSLLQNIENGTWVTGSDCLLGDSGYYLRRFMITPFNYRNGKPTKDQERFNHAHSQARGIIERTFGHLKERFRILLDTVDGHVDNVRLVVIACACLHNLALLMGEHAWPLPAEDDAQHRSHRLMQPETELPLELESDRAALRRGQRRQQEMFAVYMAGRTERTAGVARSALSIQPAM